MIPKTIHYCWFGGKNKPKDVLDCISSWKKYCPDYKIIEWNEQNYDVHKNRYMSDAYKEKKWAFVSDYARIDVIYTYGGIYLDTDVEVLKSFDALLDEEMFCGFESRDPLMKKYGMKYDEAVSFGLGFGAVKGHKVLKDLLDLYTHLNFYNSDGSLNLIACPYYQTEVLIKYGLAANQQTQRFNGGIAYSPEYFCPQSNLTNEMLHLTSNTYSIHHFSSTWTYSSKGEKELKNLLRKYLGYKCANKLASHVFAPYRLLKKLQKPT